MDVSALAGIPLQLQKITALLETQTKQLASALSQISSLTKEIDGLKTQLSGEHTESAKKDETIRKLELELEQARS